MDEDLEGKVVATLAIHITENEEIYLDIPRDAEGNIDIANTSKLVANLIIQVMFVLDEQNKDLKKELAEFKKKEGRIIIPHNVQLWPEK